MVWWLINRTASTSSTSCRWYHFSPAPRWLGWGWWEARWPCSLRKSILELQIQQQWQFSQAQINEGGSFASAFPAVLFKALPHTITGDSWLWFFVCFYKQETGNLVNPGHLDIYCGAPGDDALCLSALPDVLISAAALSTSQCPGTQQLLLQSVTGVVTHRVKYKIKLWHTGSNTKSDWSPQHWGSQEAALLCRCALYMAWKGTLQCQELKDSKKKIMQSPCSGCLSLYRSD